MRIASHNLLHGIDIRRLPAGASTVSAAAVDLAAAAEWIAAVDADVVALQEVDVFLDRSGGVDQVAWLAEHLGYDGCFAPALMGDPDREWHEAPTAGLPAGTGGYGLGLLSRVGLNAVTRTRLPYGGPGTRLPAATPTRPGVDNEPRITLSATVGDGLRVTTTHLSYMFWRAVPQLGRALEAAASGHDGPGMFLGDFNLPMWGGWLALHAWGLHPWGWPRPATRGHGWRYVPGKATYPSWKPRLQLDQVYVRHLDGPVTVEVGAAGPSDHLPLVVTV